MKKQEFLEVMNDFMKRRERREEWIDKLNELFPCAFEPICEMDSEPNFLSAMEIALNDTDKWLEYFLYECEANWFTITICGIPKTIDSYEKLYDLITKGDI